MVRSLISTTFEDVTFIKGLCLFEPQCLLEQLKNASPIRAFFNRGNGATTSAIFHVALMS